MTWHFHVALLVILPRQTLPSIRRWKWITAWVRSVRMKPNVQDVLSWSFSPRECLNTILRHACFERLMRQWPSGLRLVKNETGDVFRAARLQKRISFGNKKIAGQLLLETDCISLSFKQYMVDGRVSSEAFYYAAEKYFKVLCTPCVHHYRKSVKLRTAPFASASRVRGSVYKNKTALLLRLISQWIGNGITRQRMHE